MTIKYTKNKERRILDDDRGVSPVIAVILMVAITVVMAAIVSSWSAGVKAPTTPTTVGMDISRSNDTLIFVVTSIDPASSSPLPSMNISYKKDINGSVVSNYTLLSNVDVGLSTEIDTDNSTLKPVIITVTFKDGSKKVIYSRET
ncbi:MAG: type IV pilin [Desulfobacteraceae bacterium]|nr:type IV pilin [Desulfobacteraceae bacterium]